MDNQSNTAHEDNPDGVGEDIGPAMPEIKPPTGLSDDEVHYYQILSHYHCL